MVAVQASFSVGFTGPAGSYLGMFAQLNTSAVGGASVSAMTMSPATTIGNQQFFNLNFTSSINVSALPCPAIPLLQACTRPLGMHRHDAKPKASL